MSTPAHVHGNSLLIQCHGTEFAFRRFETMTVQVYKYKVLDADGEWREMPDMITLDRVAELDAKIILGTAKAVPRIEVSAEGHYTLPEKGTD